MQSAVAFDIILAVLKLAGVAWTVESPEGQKALAALVTVIMFVIDLVGSHGIRKSAMTAADGPKPPSPTTLPLIVLVFLGMSTAAMVAGLVLFVPPQARSSLP